MSLSSPRIKKKEWFLIELISQRCWYYVFFNPITCKERPHGPPSLPESSISSLSALSFFPLSSSIVSEVRGSRTVLFRLPQTELASYFSLLIKHSLQPQELNYWWPLDPVTFLGGFEYFLRRSKIGRLMLLGGEETRWRRLFRRIFHAKMRSTRDDRTGRNFHHHFGHFSTPS